MRVLEVMHDKTTSTMQQGIGTNHKSLQNYENNPKSLQKQHGYKLWCTKGNAQYKLKVIKVSPPQNDEKLWCTWNIYTCNLKHLHKTH